MSQSPKYFIAGRVLNKGAFSLCTLPPSLSTAIRILGDNFFILAMRSESPGFEEMFLSNKITPPMLFVDIKLASSFKRECPSRPTINICPSESIVFLYG